MEEKISREKECYFAAANTYLGFKSYFKEIFAPTFYNRLYVIKGGPGTGKSSMMRKISAHFFNKECEIEEILCSSDPKSLDGVIIKNNDKKIAILDGTAPHETDAKIPGAIDELINLGENWNDAWLAAKSREICEINSEKAEAYKTAYSYLKIAGEASGFTMKMFAESFDFGQARKKILDFCREFNAPNKKNNKTRLISAFGKEGKIKLNTLENKCKNLLQISGSEFSSFLFLNEFSTLLLSLNIPAVRFPNALQPDYLDAIYLEGSDTAIILGDGNDINADDMIISTRKYDAERIKNAVFLRDAALDEARRWFGIASDMHFRLEKIYSEAMDFEKNNELLRLKLSEMENILEV